MAISCPEKVTVCYNCYWPGHKRSECPELVGKKDGQDSKSEIPKAKARSFQLTAAEAKVEPDVVSVGDKVMLKVSPWKGVIRFRKKGKLSPRFIGPFTIIERVGKVAYRLDLLEELSRIHSTFHVSHLRKCLADETSYIHYDDIEVDDRLNYVVKPVAILDRKVKTLRNKKINQVKVKWEHKKGADTTWEFEEEMQRLYPTLFVT
ncbi:uncharacterized protein LOC110887567 [Helianthus annuus]|uniref:uncharacterized protein LOC110887567 n=1 Tax=Helianthus annuus TaxID=4232 RepID=UPI000B905E6F|nr:uncharacterized protein LOC110887567 [Helianthus annuus]